MFKNIENYEKPLDILKGMEKYGYTGMSGFELSFICGLIKQYKPKKIVEVGVGAGGTTSVMLNCLSLLGYDFKMYSVDICSKWYGDVSKDTGFVAQQLIHSNKLCNINHTFLFGHTIAHTLDDVGGDIDLIILDTMHSLPGELLDFISSFHSLSKDAIVVLHDVGQSQHGNCNVYGAPFEYASLVTMSTVVGDKILPFDKNNMAGFPNIGAFKINNDTYKHVNDWFLALFINWNYIPQSWQIAEYRYRIEKDYGVDYCQMFDKALECNEFSLYRRKGFTLPLHLMYNRLNKAIVESKKNVYIYGHGEIAHKVHRYLCGNLLSTDDIKGFIVSDRSVNINNNYPVFELYDLNVDEKNFVIILGLKEEYHLDVLKLIYKYGYQNNVFPYNGIGFREMLEIMLHNLKLSDDENTDYENSYGYEVGIREAGKLFKE